jgi:short-subunit dehydrogenase
VLKACGAATQIDDPTRRLALITGASSGIGQAFARRLGNEGYDLVVSGRRRDRLEMLRDELPDVTVRAVVTDLGTYAGIETLAEVCATEDLTMLVNNAGISHYMPFVALPADKADELLHVKVVAPTMLARAAAARMAARGRGTIINVSGMLAFSGPATLEEVPLRRAIYVATLAHLVAPAQTARRGIGIEGAWVLHHCKGLHAGSVRRDDGPA